MPKELRSLQYFFVLVDFVVVGMSGTGSMKGNLYDCTQWALHSTYHILAFTRVVTCMGTARKVNTVEIFFLDRQSNDK